jgi:hypothetical protein
MKLFGYEEGNYGRGSPLALCEASILASPVELRAIAKVLADLAVEMEADGFDHVHLTDRVPSFGDGPELIVAKAR